MGELLVPIIFPTPFGFGDAKPGGDAADRRWSDLGVGAATKRSLRGVGWRLADDDWRRASDNFSRRWLEVAGTNTWA